MRRPEGPLVVDFDDGRLPEGWLTGGTRPWGVSNDRPYNGGFAAESGAISDLSNSWLRTTIDLPADGFIRSYTAQRPRTISTRSASP